MPVIVPGAAQRPAGPRWPFPCEKPVVSARFPAARCRRCPSCLARKRWEWTARAVCECEAQPRSFMFTLTFRPGPDLGDEKSRYAEVSKWLKLVRKHVGKLRFVCTQEYGDKAGRLHYHLLVHPDTAWSRTNYRQAKGLWKFGWSDVKVINMRRIRYVCKYLGKDAGRVRASTRYGASGAAVWLQEVVGAPVVDAVLSAFPRARITRCRSRFGGHILRRVLEEHEDGRLSYREAQRVSAIQRELKEGGEGPA